jgi:two-component system response regulator VicR
MSKILIIEDELNISNLLKLHLEREGYQVSQVFDGLAAMDAFLRLMPDLVILDLMLPGKNGLDICKEIREKYDTYILMLTAKQEEVDKVLGLELGADDYVIKPFSIRELLSRVKVLLRRPHLNRPEQETEEQTLSLGELELRPSQMEARLGGQRLLLTSLEFDILYFLMRNKGIVFKREQLLEKIWGDDSYVYDRSIDRIISQLRKKIESNPASPKRIVTIWGVGYKFDENS